MKTGSVDLFPGKHQAKSGVDLVQAATGGSDIASRFNALFGNTPEARAARNAMVQGATKASAKAEQKRLKKLRRRY